MERIRNLPEPVTVSPRLQDVLDMDTLVIRDWDRQDKATALFNLARMLDQSQVRYAIIGGMAVRLYCKRSRSTVSIDVVCEPATFSRPHAIQGWREHEFNLVEDRASLLCLRDDTSNVNVFIYQHRSLLFLLEELEHEYIGDQRISFTTPLLLAISKIQTQKQDWPRDIVGRLQDRIHVMHLLGSSRS